MQGDPLIERVIGRAVRLNGLLIPAEGVDTALARYVQQLCVHFDVKEWPFSLAGSTTLIAYRSRFFAVCCRHQLKGHDLQKACLIVNGGADVITSGGHSMFPEANATDFHDLMAFDFTEPCAAGALNPSLFFHFSQLPPDHLVEDVVCIVCAGYPTSAQRYEVDEGRLGSARCRVLCKPGPDSQDPALKRALVSTPLSFDPDGMSGGSAFVCLDDGGRFEAYFAGVITRGGCDGFYFVKSGAVRRFLDMAISLPSARVQTHQTDT